MVFITVSRFHDDNVNIGRHDEIINAATISRFVPVVRHDCKECPRMTTFTKIIFSDGGSMVVGESKEEIVKKAQDEEFRVWQRKAKAHYTQEEVRSGY